VAPATPHQGGLIVPRGSLLSIERIVERMAALSAPRHRELVRAMLSELESIADPAERRRFALGALAAVVRLAMSRYTGSTIHELGRFVGIPAPAENANSRGPSMPKLSTRQLLRRHVIPFGVPFALMTTLILANSAARLWPQVSTRGEPTAALLEALLLATPSAMALTIPMAVFIAVAWVFTRFGRDGILAAAGRQPHGIRRLTLPVVVAAAVISALTAVLNAEVLPRANARFTALLAEGPIGQYDRSMSLGELREAARNARADAGPDAAAIATVFEVEIQKKFALAAACLVLALGGAAIALRFPRGGIGLVIGASGVVFTGYYISLVAGESLADQQLVSPFVGMWMANGILLALVLLLVWRSGGPGRHYTETLAVGG
jgi:lipopolysaccharide export LptBFGC system permease protein LptF